MKRFGPFHARGRGLNFSSVWLGLLSGLDQECTQNNQDSGTEKKLGRVMSSFQVDPMNQAG
jgi:hypothetical protein